MNVMARNEGEQARQWGINQTIISFGLCRTQLGNPYKLIIGNASVISFTLMKIIDEVIEFFML